MEKWSADELAAFARSPRFQSEDDVRALQVELEVYSHPPVTCTLSEPLVVVVCEVKPFLQVL